MLTTITRKADGLALAGWLGAVAAGAASRARANRGAAANWGARRSSPPELRARGRPAAPPPAQREGKPEVHPSPVGERPRPRATEPGRDRGAWRQSRPPLRLGVGRPAQLLGDDRQVVPRLVAAHACVHA